MRNLICYTAPSVAANCAGTQSLPTAYCRVKIDLIEVVQAYSEGMQRAFQMGYQVSMNKSGKTERRYEK